MTETATKPGLRRRLLPSRPGRDARSTTARRDRLTPVTLPSVPGSSADHAGLRRSRKNPSRESTEASTTDDGVRVASRSSSADPRGRLLRRRSSRRPETSRAGGSDRSSRRRWRSRCSLADCWSLNHALRGHAGWAGRCGRQPEAGDVGAGAQSPKHRALGELHPPRRRRESNGFLTRAVEGDGMRVR